MAVRHDFIAPRSAAATESNLTFSNMPDRNNVDNVKKRKKKRKASTTTTAYQQQPARDRHDKTLLIAQEIKMARLLAGNTKPMRDRALKHLRKWLKAGTPPPFTYDDFRRIWKGLFYSMWMSDKPLIQEECAENISQLIHCLPPDRALVFFHSALNILISEWFGIDQLRLDKFLMLVRRLLRQAFVVLRNEHWSKVWAQKFTHILTRTVVNATKPAPLGLFMHFTEIYLEELAKISQGKIRTTSLLIVLLTPFIELLLKSTDSRQVSHVREFIFAHLIRQSHIGLDYHDKYAVWRQMGFPGSIDDLQKIRKEQSPPQSDDDNDEITMIEEDEGGEVVGALDPRAGRVNVDLPQILFNAKQIADTLVSMKFNDGSTVKSRKVLTKVIDQFRKLSMGTYPMAVRKVVDDQTLDQVGRGTVRKAVNRLVKYDREIVDGVLSSDRKRRRRRRRTTNTSSSPSLPTVETPKLLLVTNGNKSMDDGLLSSINDRSINIKKTKISNGIGKKKKKQQIMEETLVNDSKIKYIFRRNSGTWFVTDRGDGGNTDDATNTTTINTSMTTRNRRTGSKRKTTTTASTSSNRSLKKIVINTRLNRSQEVDEHEAQLLSSPSIPYCADKRPVRPILKTASFGGGGPINPFYVHS